MKKIAIITVALMMTAPVTFTFALPAAADQLKVGTSVKLERDAQLPSCQKVEWYRLCNRYEGCSWVLRDDDKNAWVGFYDQPQGKND